MALFMARRIFIYFFVAWAAAVAMLATAAFVAAIPAVGAEQQYEEMSDSVRSSLRRRIAGSPPPRLFFADKEEGRKWLNEMSRRLAEVLPRNSVLQDETARREFLIAAHYEATRAGLDPQLVLAVIHVESAFREYAVSHAGFGKCDRNCATTAGARGLMQVMPFWTREIGDGNVRKLFQMQTNLRYGSVILRHYLDLENGDMTRALARYNGSVGRTTYPNLVHSKLQKHWIWRGGE